VECLFLFGGGMAIQLGSAYGKVSLDSSGIQKGVSEGIQSIAKLTAAGTNLGNSLKTIGSSLTSFGQQMTLAFTLPLAALGAKSFQVMKDFDGNLNVLKAVANATNEELEAMTKLARQLGADLTLPGTSAADAAGAMAELAKAGLQVNDIMAASKGVLQLSAAGQIDNARAAEITANALNAFKLKGEDAIIVADLLAASANASSAEVSEMADSLQMSAAVMSMSGITIQETVAALGLLANAGIQGSDAGTSLKQMFLALQTPSREQVKIINRYGLEIYNAAGEMKSMRELIVEFTSKLSGLTEENRNFALGVLFGSDAVRAANIVLMQGTEQYDKMSTAINKTGAAASLAGALMEGLPGVVENIKSSFETAAIAALEPFKEDIIAVGQAVAKVLNTFSNLPEPIRKIIVVMLGLLALAGPVLMFIGTVLTMVGTVINAIGVLSTMGITLTGVATGVGAIGTAITTTLIPAVIAFGTAAIPVLIPILAVLGVILWTVGLLVIAWKTNFLNIREVMTAAAKIIKSLWSALMAFLRGDMDGTLEHLREALDTFLQYWRDLFAKFSGIRDAFTNFMNWLRTALGRVRDYIVTAFSNVDWGQVGRFILLGIANGMLLGLPSLLLTVANVAQSVLDQIKQSLGISSPSAEAMKLGAFTAQGYMLGIQKAMDAELVARSLARPVTNNSSQQQTIIQNFASGVTIRQVRELVASSEERIMSAMIGALE
jgi:TP901 family phage tail tape measure protein